MMGDLPGSETKPTVTPEKIKSKKAHLTSQNVSRTRSCADAEGTGHKQEPYYKTCGMPQIGIVTAATSYNKEYKDTDDILKHLCVAYLCTILKPPSKWTAETFAELVDLESTVAEGKLTAKLPIRKNDKTYNIHLSSTLVKGRFVSTAPVRPSVHQALARFRRGKAAIWTCDSHFFLIRRVLEGFYFYSISLRGKPALMFFISSRVMVNFVKEAYGCSELSKYYLSNVVLHSVEEDDVIRVVWKMKRCVGMRMADGQNTLLHGNIYLVRPSFERSLEIGLNVLERVGPAQPSSWDNKALNGCFKRSQLTWEAAQKITPILRDRNELPLSVGPYHIACRTTAIGHRQRKHFEELVNYFLASCTALLVVGLDCCFLLWVRESFNYWFSPYQYSSLQDKHEMVPNRASFLHMSNVLSETSQALYAYLYELGIFPDHTVELLPLLLDERRQSEAPESGLDEDSVDQEGFTIPPASERGWSSFYATSPHSSSVLRLARQMLDTVYRTAEDRCD